MIISGSGRKAQSFEVIMSTTTLLSLETREDGSKLYNHPTGLQVALSGTEVTVTIPGQDPIKIQQPEQEWVEVLGLTYSGPKGQDGAVDYLLETKGCSKWVPETLTRLASGQWTCGLFQDGRSYPTPQKVLEAVKSSLAGVSWHYSRTIDWPRFHWLFV
jgi:hypothetical protein